MNTSILPLHSIVTWTSSYTQKTGKIVGFIPWGSNVYEIYPDMRLISISQNKFGGEISRHNRYLIRVDRVDCKGKDLVPYFYAPREAQHFEVKE